jgi:hypothetical protein
MLVVGRHHPPPSGDHAVKRLPAKTRRLVRDALRRDPQDRWAAAFGRIAGYSVAVAVVTGAAYRPGSGRDSEHAAEYPGSSVPAVLPLLHDFPDPGRSHRFPCSSPPSDTYASL